MCEKPFKNPSIVHKGGLTSQITRAFIHLAVYYNMYVVVEVFHNSIILQVADLGVYRYIKNKYAIEYNAAMCACELTGQLFDDTERIGCVVRTWNSLRHNNRLI